MEFTLTDIETILLFILFIRFIILSIKYNLKTSFYITCIGFFAGYLWYNHLQEILQSYKQLGMLSIRSQDSEFSENISLFNPIGILSYIYYSFKKGITYTHPTNELIYYIDPISMLISGLPEAFKVKIIPIYYGVLPKLLNSCQKFISEISGIAAYAIITRIGKKYCPYLIRWHWTFLLILGLVEGIVVAFVNRCYYFQQHLLVSTVQGSLVSTNTNLVLLNLMMEFIIVVHIGIISLALFHAIWGQYFYIPFFVENVELHIGPRPVNSIYSGGQTSWQNKKNSIENFNRLFPKLWYGWFGRGTQTRSVPNKNKNFKKIRKIIKRILKMLGKQFSK